MFPPVGVVYDEYIVEQHRAETKQQNLADVSNQHRGIITIRFEALQTLAILVAERKDAFGQDVA